MAKIKAHSLTGRITQPLLIEAFRNVKRNRGAAGIDKVSIQLYEKNLLENFPHAIIMAGVADEVADGNILHLVERFLKAGVMEEGCFRPTSVGTPQGGVISPLLANIGPGSRTASQRGGTGHGELLRHPFSPRCVTCFARWSAGYACVSGA